jgi:PHD-finger
MNIHELVCELCGGGHREDKIILCDRCDRGCHLFCLHPPLMAVPNGEWVCPLCIAEDAAKAGAFKEGHVYSLDEFEKIAAAFKKKWWSSDGKSKKVRSSWRGKAVFVPADPPIVFPPEG